MKPERIVHVLLEGEDEFDAREYLTQSTLEPTATRLGLEWLNWGVWYKEIGPWRLYVDPWEKQPWMEVEVGMDTGNDQIKIVDMHVDQQAASEILPEVVRILTQHADHNLEHSDNGVGDKVAAVLKPHMVYESGDFDARQFFTDMQPVAARVALDLDFDRAQHGFRKVIGQWIVDVTAGDGESVVDVRRDFGWQREMVSMWYAKDDRVEQLLQQVVAICQAHTNEDGWAVDEKQAYQKFGAIPK